MKRKSIPIERENDLFIIVVSVFILFSITRMFIAGSGYFSLDAFLKYKWFGEPKSFLDLFFKWDSNWYLSIVKNGYSYVADKQSNVAFYPLYPLFVKIISTVVGNTKAVGFLISNIGLLTGAFYLYRIILHETKDHNICLIGVFLLLANPMSFFHSAFYAEGLFLGLTVASFYYALQNKLLL
ncbi:MAG: mannosyltransferase family protein, partial [Desulfohalobiaceae bacterium]